MKTDNSCEAMNPLTGLSSNYNQFSKSPMTGKLHAQVVVQKFRLLFNRKTKQSNKKLSTH